MGVDGCRHLDRDIVNVASLENLLDLRQSAISLLAAKDSLTQEVDVESGAVELEFSQGSRQLGCGGINYEVSDKFPEHFPSDWNHNPRKQRR